MRSQPVRILKHHIYDQPVAEGTFALLFMVSSRGHFNMNLL